jgi:hypothetical protein
MSALLEKPKTQARPATSPRPATKPQVKPNLHVQAKIIQRKRTNYGAIALSKCALFAVSMGLTYMASSFSGQVLLEGARQERIEAKRRATEAKEAEAVLTAKLDAIVSAAGVEQWALAHGYVAPESQIDPKSKTRGLLASR